MQVSGRAVAWSLGFLAVGLFGAGLLAIAGVMGLDETVLGTYNGIHVLGVLLAVIGGLAFVAAVLRRPTNTFRRRTRT